VPHSRRLAAAIPGSRLIISPGCGHMMPLERDDHVSQQLFELTSPALERRLSVEAYATREEAAAR